MVRRYEILSQIPKALADIDSDMHTAHRCRAGDPGREGLILAAADTAHGTLVGLTQDALLWMALQRQVMVRGWRFQDLQQLDQLTVPATVDLLIALRVGRKQQAEILLREAIAAERPAAEDFINQARAKLDEVKLAAVQAAAAEGLTAPSAKQLLVDHAHIEATKVRWELNTLISAWRAEQDHETEVQKREARLQTILKRCGTAVGVIAFLTAAALQIPEVQHVVVEYSVGLAQVVEQLAESIRARIDELGAIGMQPDALKAITANIGALGFVAATSIASKPDEGFSLIDPGRGLNGPPPSGAPDSEAANFDSVSRPEPTVASKPGAVGSPRNPSKLPHHVGRPGDGRPPNQQAHTKSMTTGPRPAESNRGLPPGAIDRVIELGREGAVYRELGSSESQRERGSGGARPAP